MFPWCFTILAFAPDLGNALKRVQSLMFGEEIGQGSICRVYQATCPSSNEQFAVKRISLPKSVCKRAEVLQRAAREAAAARALSDLVPHPDEIVRHFACVYDEGEDTIDLVMELCRGPCLAQLRNQTCSGCLPESRVRNMAAAVARALGHLHGIGLLCIDLKAENVVLDPTEQVQYVCTACVRRLGPPTSTSNQYESSSRMFILDRRTRAASSRTVRHAFQHKYDISYMKV
ncbi:hypothetical protein Vafri_21448 [Volvox africanus]|uniref:Protein kinase domain-containing protein n=1 Tax=Volvox africanus TaxID=51714 RepID=A0A8J4FEX9_9CHLO|nr:hypothetical protein Vafri_21448 [Volvox africanus]